MRHIWLVLVLIGVVSLGWGLHQGQAQHVKAWATTLCTSCIGLIDREYGH
jgi:hypothetical protein